MAWRTVFSVLPGLISPLPFSTSPASTSVSGVIRLPAMAAPSFSVSSASSQLSRLASCVRMACAASITAGDGLGQTAMISRTPAMRAGIAVISSEEGSAYRPPGT